MLFGAQQAQRAFAGAAEGRALFVVPNRSGLWARREATPFGFGRPYSLGQLESHLKRGSFTPEGHRAWLVRGSEARFNGEDRIDIKDLTLSIFTGEADGKLDTLILSPTAELRPGESLASGPGAIRVINDQFEATGTGWKYAHKDKRISIAKNVRVVFHAEFKDLLK